ncbi:alpha/beta fold hydrolase [Pontibacter qinzhouensis]|uniref:Alpha/beta fold hydrolase n=1 Tax=Pontibacter qinzhouensis TaxID=2603253 RepID=A0A5C8J130_9BACT|nr:alpha/beta fold hydrolase [Pontibacter qinzhouensis]TXK27405.1 alpha/beta fold hydrolase [Pontibacter qinzhouensis]
MKSQKDLSDLSFRMGTLKLATGTLTYIDEGAGAPLVVVHGTPSWPSLYRPLLKKLSSQYRCIVIDSFVSAQTGQQEDWTYNPKSHTHLLTQLLQSLHLKHMTLLLHNAGTPAGLAYAIQQADRVKNLVLLNTSSCTFSGNRQQAGSSNRPTLHLGKLLYARLHAFRPTLAKKLASQQGARQVPGAEELADITAWYNEQWKNRHTIQDITTLLLWGECDKLTSMKSLQKWKQFFHECYVIHLENSTYSLEGGNMDDIAGYLKNFMVEEHKKRETISLSA